MIPVRTLLAFALLAWAAAVRLRATSPSTKSKTAPEAAVVAAQPVRGAVNCGSPGDHMKLSAVGMNPLQPVQGQPAALNGTGVVDEVITGGSGTLSVTLDSVNLYSATVTTCGTTSISIPLFGGTLLWSGLSCPTTAGQTQNISLTLTLPVGIPSGSYAVQVSAGDQNGASAYCLEADFSE